MAERKCGVCREPGHTKRTCLVAGTVELLMDGHPVTPDQASRLLDAVEEPIEFNATAPIYTGAEPGPWFDAAFPGICEKGGEGFEQGEEIRADGQGGYECSDCVSDAQNTPSAPPAWDRPTAANVKLPPVPDSVPLAIDVRPAVPAFPDGVFNDPSPAANPAADLFASPAPIMVTQAESDPDPLTGRTGYLIKDPRTGEYDRYKNGNVKGFTRMTTFIDKASDTVGLNDWHKRNVVMGAVLRPDLVAQARGMTHAENKAQLDTIAGLLAEAAGGSRGSDNGTLVHDLTEKLDLKQITLAEVPAQFRQLCTDYLAELDRAGLAIVPDLVERVVFLSRFGGVGGKFDRIYLHVATGTYVMGDVKTGKTLDLGFPKIEAQLWGYTTAYNEFGTWDHTAKVWEPPQYQVRTDYGVVVHMPVEGPKPGLPPLPVSLQRTDMARGEAWARLCATVGDGRKAGGKPVPWSLPAPVAVAEPSWDDWFSGVTTSAEAGKLWQKARDAGVEPMELNRLVQLAQSALREAGVTG